MNKQFYLVLLGLLFAGLGVMAQTSFINEGVKYVVKTDGYAYVADNTDMTTTDVVIPATVSYGGNEYVVLGVEDDAFKSNTRVQTVEIEGNVKYIGANAFYGCTSLSSVKLPDYMKDIRGFAFWGCSSLKSIDIPTGVNYVRRQTFWNCTSLTSVTLPATLYSIDIEAFSGCSKLEAINLPESILQVDVKSFDGCTSLKTVTCRGDNPPDMGNINAFTDYTYANAELRVPAGADYIYQQAYGWDCFSKITGVEDIGQTTFSYLGVKYGIDDDSHAHVYINATLGGVVTIPQTVYKGKKAYDVVAIGDYAFAWNTDVKTVKIEGNISKIGKCAFYEATGLATVSLPETITSIGTQAFWSCRALSSIAFPASLTHIGEKAFAGCKTMKSVVCQSSLPPVMDHYNAFSDDTYDTAELTVPQGSYYDYIQAYGWDLFKNTKGSSVAAVGADSDVPSDVYNMQGILLKHNATADDLRSLPAGIYIVGGKKMVIMKRM